MKQLISISMILILALNGARSQDLHFTQYQAAPLSLNPAFAGFTNGNLRLAGNYRNQWFNVSSFATYAFSADANIARSKMNHHILGAGISFFQDVEEKNGLTNTNISFTTAFNVKLSQSPLQYLGVGIQPSFIRRQVDLMNAVYGTFYETGTNTDPLGFEEYGSFKFDLNMGMSYYALFDDRHSFATGFSLSHVNQPDFGVLTSDELYRKYAVYLLTEFSAGQSGFAWIGPRLYFMKQGPSLEFMPGVHARFGFSNAINDIQLGVGMAARFVGHNTSNLSSTDFVGSVQLIVEGFTLGFSYDVAVSDLKNATGRNGGPELSLMLDLDFEKGSGPSYFRIMRF